MRIGEVGVLRKPTKKSLRQVLIKSAKKKEIIPGILLRNFFMRDALCQK